MSDLQSKLIIGAVVQDPDKRFLLTYKPTWNGYCFPVHRVQSTEEVSAAEAIRSVERDLGVRLPHATASHLEFIVSAGPSGSTGQMTSYDIFLFEVDPHESFDAIQDRIGQSENGGVSPPRWFSYAEITEADDITWSGLTIVQDFVEFEDIVLSIIPRAGKRETEVLLVWNETYGGYFFPAQRIKTSDGLQAIARSTVRNDLGYRGEVIARSLAEVPDRHHSHRYGVERNFRFHLCETLLPKVDLHLPMGILEHFLYRQGHRCKWVEVSRLGDSHLRFSPTMESVRVSIRNLLPNYVLGDQIRRSRGVVTLFRRTSDGRRHWLTRFHDQWRKFVLIFGQRDADESVDECVRRTLTEQLGLAVDGLEVGDQHGTYLNFHAVSRSTGELTNYTLNLVDCGMSANVLNELERAGAYQWMSEEDILRLEDSEGRPIHETVLSFLFKAGELNAPAIAES